MNKGILLALCVVLSLSLTACGDNSSNSNDSVSSNSSQINIDDDKENEKGSENKRTTNIDTDKQPATQSVQVIKSFFAVEGAVIYDQTYDEYGYPDCCYFHKKCEACGDISNNNGSARGNVTTSYYCPKCKTPNHVEIQADSEWIEVNK